MPTWSSAASSVRTGLHSHRAIAKMAIDAEREVEAGGLHLQRPG
jgi:hypothetical protein